jgi:hypothetical protein
MHAWAFDPALLLQVLSPALWMAAAGGADLDEGAAAFLNLTALILELLRRPY